MHFKALHITFLKCSLWHCTSRCSCRSNYTTCSAVSALLPAQCKVPAKPNWPTLDGRHCFKPSLKLVAVNGKDRVNLETSNARSTRLEGLGRSEVVAWPMASKVSDRYQVLPVHSLMQNPKHPNCGIVWKQHIHFISQHKRFISTWMLWVICHCAHCHILCSHLRQDLGDLQLTQSIWTLPMINTTQLPTIHQVLHQQ